MVKRDGYYIGQGVKHIIFTSDNPQEPAKFYVVSTSAYRHYPNKKLPFKNALATTLGNQAHMNKRTIY